MAERDPPKKATESTPQVANRMDLKPAAVVTAMPVKVQDLPDVLVGTAEVHKVTGIEAQGVARFEEASSLTADMLKGGLSAILIPDSQPELRLSAYLRRKIGSKLGNEVEVQIPLQRPDAKSILKPGDRGRLYSEKSPAIRRVIAVPAVLIRRDNQGTPFVLLLQPAPGTQASFVLSRRTLHPGLPVRPYESAPEQVLQLAEGDLKPDELLLVDGPPGLKEGQLVVKWQEPDSGTPHCNEVRFKEHKAGQAVDTRTGLIWERKPSDDEEDYATAKKYCAEKDMRLPTYNEFLALAFLDQAADSCYELSGLRETVWTSSPGEFVGHHYALDVLQGAKYSVDPNAKVRILCVRNGR